MVLQMFSKILKSSGALSTCKKKNRLKLQNMGAGQRNSDRIKAEIYGSQNNVLLQAGIADAINKDGFMAKFESLCQA